MYDSLKKLVEADLVSEDHMYDLKPVTERYAVGVSTTIAELIAQDLDGVSQQFIPDSRELKHLAQERHDPIGDEIHSPTPGLVHRYPDRVLLKLTKLCAVYCRFCFRREHVGPGKDTLLSSSDIERAIKYIQNDSQIFEVIFTGGDPLILSPRRLRTIIDRLEAIDHIKIIRFHTRVPMVTPKRVERSLISALSSSRLRTFIAIHANHPNEFSTSSINAIRKLREAGFGLLSQSVLLAGINSDVATLAALMRNFVCHGVKPYYLHHPDLAPGTSHFRLPLSAGIELVRALRGNLSGLCQPTYVLDLPGGYGKIVVNEANIRPYKSGWMIKDYRGMEHFYADQI